MSKRPSMKQQDRISLLLSQHCSTDDDGYAVFVDGWDDDRIAAAVNAVIGGEEPINGVSVERRRRAIYGNVRKPATSNQGKIEALEIRISMLESHIAHLTNEVAKALGMRYTAYKAPPGKVISTPPSE